VYGTESFESYFKTLCATFSGIADLDYFQSNVEGELINKLQEIGFSYDGIVLNAGAYTHTSIAIADAVAAIKTPVIEVHISNIFAREDYRHVSYLGKYCKGSISGFGLAGYEMAVRAF
jgi:3-dehydroquinate dehydratase-2